MIEHFNVLSWNALLDLAHGIFQILGVSSGFDSEVKPLDAIDPSWFFSSLSQSAAAIVGLIGAILITLLVQRQSENIEDGRRILSDYLLLRMDTKVDFEKTKQRAKDLAELLQIIGPSFSAGQSSLRMMDTSKEWNLAKGLKIRFLNNAQGVCHVDKDQYNNLVEMNANINRLISAMRRFKEQEDLEDCDDICDEIVSLIESNGSSAFHVFHQRARFIDLSSDVRLYNQSRVPKFFYIMIVVVAYLGVAGVLAPLYHLYAGIDFRIKEFYLILFSVGLLAVLVILVMALLDIRKARIITVPRRLQQ